MRQPQAEPSLKETVALGLLQGPAELLPISSSAHVELVPWLLGWDHARLRDSTRKEIEVALHAGTAVTLVAVRGRAVLGRPWLTALATAPPAVVALLLEERIERHLGGPRTMAAGLLAGSLALVVSDRVAARRVADDAGVWDALALGVAQVAALWPGVSRSGATRSAARALGFGRADAKALSGEVAIGVLAGATALKGVRLASRRPSRHTLVALAAGGAAAALSSRAALGLDRLTTLPPWAWAVYRCALAGAVLVATRSDRELRQNRPL